MKIKVLFISLSLLTIPSFTISAEEESSIFDEVVVTARKEKNLLNLYLFRSLHWMEIVLSQEILQR